MNEFLEFEEVKKSLKELNFDDFSVKNTYHYIFELKKED